MDSGGQNVYVAHLAKGLTQLGFRVDVFTRRDSPGLPETVCRDGFRVVHVPAGPPRAVCKEELLPYMEAFSGFMQAFVKRTGYDLVHANFFLSGLVAADLKRALGLPFVVTFHALGRVRRLHQGQADTFSDERFAVEARVIAEANRIIAEFPQDEEDLIHFYGADPAKITTIPCGFDPAEMQPRDKGEARAELDLPPGEPVILQLGRMVPRKGVETVVRALAHLRDDHDLAARLLVVGGESERPDPKVTPEIGRLQEVARAERVAEQVTFTGRRDHDALNAYYSAADVFVSVPWYEPFGMTPLEAMACGVPVVGSRVGGVKYTVLHGKTGFLVPPKDPPALAERLAQLLADPELARRLGACGRRRANARFTWRRVCADVAALYREVLQEVLAEVPPVSLQGSEAELAIIERGFAESLAALERARKQLRPDILEAARMLGEGLARGNKVLVCGNGGSAAAAQHFATELVGRFVRPQRAGLPVLALTDSAVLTAWANDCGYEQVFARQVEAFGRPGDLLVGLSTSGCSRNVVEAFRQAERQGVRRLALSGKGGGELRRLAEINLVVPSSSTQRIQEVHLLVLHLLCEIVEEHYVNDAVGVPGFESELLAIPGEPSLVAK